MFFQQVADAKLDALVSGSAAAAVCDDALRFPGVDELQSALTALTASGDAPPRQRQSATLVSRLMGSFRELSCLQHIPLLVHFYHWLHSTFAHRVTQEDAMELTVARAIETLLEDAEKVRCAALYCWFMHVTAGV